MQMLKAPLSFCVVALVATSIAHAQTYPDSDVQAKAREALRQKTSNGAAQSPAMPSSNIKVSNTSGVSLSMTPQSNAAQEDQVRSELRRKMDELNGQANSTTSGAAQSMGGDDQSKLVEAMRQKKAELDAKDHSLQDSEMAKHKANEDLMAQQKDTGMLTDKQKRDADLAAKQNALNDAAAQKRAVADMNSKQLTEGMVAPASPLTSAKDQKLNDLLQLYRADKITPAEYHMQRAKIIAEP